MHEQEIANAAAKAKEDLAKQNLTLKHDPTKDIVIPAGNQAAGFPAGAAPEIAEVIAPGVPREVIVRQQQQIEEMIRAGGRAGPGAGLHWLPHHHGAIPPHRHHPAQWQDGFVQRMGEILRLREQNRANLRMVRQREQEALREIERCRRGAVQAPAILDHGIRGFGIPQAVPEPAPFLDLVEAQGRNIHVVQQQRLPGRAFLAGPAHRYGPPAPGGPPGVPGPAAVRVAAPALPFLHEDRERGRVLQARLGRRLEEARDLAQRGRELRQQQQREIRDRVQRGRDEAVARLRRNQAEVLRRQRRHREELAAPAGQVRVERLPNTFQHRVPAEQRVEAVRGRHHRQPGPPGVAAAPQRDFNFQEILDLDNLNPALLGEDLENV